MSVQSMFERVSISARRLEFVFVADSACNLRSKEAAAGLAFIGEMEEALRVEGLSGNAQALLFVSVMKSLVERGNLDLSVELGKACEMGMGNPQVREVLDEINDRYVVPSGLEITSHGLLRSFRFWNEEEKANYVTEVHTLIDDLLELSPDTCLGYGGVLSLVRDGGLNPHDDDLDVLVGFNIDTVPTFGEGVTRLLTFLESRNWKVCGHWPAFLKVRAQKMAADIDVFVALNEGGMLASIPGPRRKIPWASLFPAGTIHVFGRDVAIPVDAESYLSFVYGADWKVPKRGWQHSWNYSAYKDIT